MRYFCLKELESQDQLLIKQKLIIMYENQTLINGN